MNKSNKNKVKNKENTFFIDFVRVTGLLPTLIWTRPKTIYIGDRKKSLLKKGVLIASNHISFSDPIILYSVYWRRRIRFLATKDLYKNKLITFLFTAVGCIQLNKENVNMSFFHTVIDKLKLGNAVVIFPEGQVNQNDEMLSFKQGAVLMSQLSGAPIQPVYITKRKKWYHRCVAIIGEPIDVRSMCSPFPNMDELSKVNDYIHLKEQELEKYYIDNIKSKEK